MNSSTCLVIDLILMVNFLPSLISFTKMNTKKRTPFHWLKNLMKTTNHQIKKLKNMLLRPWDSDYPKIKICSIWQEKASKHLFLPIGFPTKAEMDSTITNIASLRKKHISILMISSIAKKYSNKKKKWLEKI